MANDPSSLQSRLRVSNDTAYLLWLLSIVGVCGAHRFYLGKPLSGILYLVTFGFFGIGQLVDLILIPSMVDDQNLKYRMLYGSGHLPAIASNRGNGYSPIVQAPGFLSSPRLNVQILKTCRDQQGATLSDCVIATGVSPEEVKATVKDLCRADLLSIDNRASDGAVIYKAV
ncbi:MAG: TM2 domain-containing protein [Acaryochloridaceae cyanobacterium SU_2_1]|nr:TM2 domain-containing protein [Acaryochloridaceae cyanobacterium SU_2_1]